jgi:ribosomal protein L35
MKRLRVTKKGKIISRVPGQNHFNAKRSGKETRRHHRADVFHAALDNTAKSRFLTK